MEVYDSEREQIEAMKKWWQANGKAVVTGLILGVASLVGWQQWSAYVTTSRETASVEYDVLMQELEMGQSDAVRQRGLRIIADYNNTPYAVLAALAVAKVAADSDDLVMARAQLQAVIDKAEEVELQHIARARLARIMISEGQPSQALKTLQSVQPVGFESLYDEVMGDAHAALGNTDQARASYERAIAGFDEAGVDTSFLRIKLDELGVLPEATS